MSLQATNDVVYTILFPSKVDPLELSKSNSCAFLHKCDTTFVNTKRIFAEITWYATNEEGAALTSNNFISSSGPQPHQLIGKQSRIHDYISRERWTGNVDGS